MFREWERSITGWVWVGHWGCSMTRKKGRRLAARGQLLWAGDREHDKSWKKDAKRESFKNETKFRRFTGMSPGFEMIRCLPLASTFQCVFVGARREEEHRWNKIGCMMTDDTSDGYLGVHHAILYFIYFQFLSFFFKILKVSHWTQDFLKNLYNGLYNLASSSPVTSLASFPPTPCYSLSSPGTPLTVGLCKSWSLCSELSVLSYPHSLLTYWE